MRKEEIEKYNKIIKYGSKFYALFFAFIFVNEFANIDSDSFLLNQFMAVTFIFFEAFIFIFNIFKNKKLKIPKITLFFLIITLFFYVCLFHLNLLFGFILLLMFYWALRTLVPNFRTRVAFYLFLLVWSFVLQDYHTKLFYGLTGSIVKKEFTKELNSLELTNSANLVCEEATPASCKFIRMENIKFKTDQDWGSSNYNIVCAYGCPK